MYKKTLAAVTAALLCAAAFADGIDGSRFYGKLSVGKERRTDSWTTSYDGGGSGSADATTELTLITPTVGMTLAPDSDNFFVKGLSLEVGLGLGFGKKEGGTTTGNSDGGSSDYDDLLGAYGDLLGDYDDLSDNLDSASGGSSVIAVIPRADLVWHVLIPGSPVVPFARVGIGVPIQVAWTGSDKISNYAVSFELSTGLGVLFNVSERVGLLADARFAFGPSSGVAVSFGTRFK